MIENIQCSKLTPLPKFKSKSALEFVVSCSLKKSAKKVKVPISQKDGNRGKIFKCFENWCGYIR